MVKDRRAWGAAWWKYYHISEECMKAFLIVGIPQWDQQAQQGILKVTIDFAPLPKTKKEKADQLEALQDESKTKLINVLNSIQSKM